MPTVAPERGRRAPPRGVRPSRPSFIGRATRRPSALTAEAADGISDLQFTARYRVPFQFSRIVREHLRSGTFLQSSSGVTVTDLDGNSFYDLTGSYGVNVFGYDFYKDCIAQRRANARAASARCSAPIIR